MEVDSSYSIPSITASTDSFALVDKIGSFVTSSLTFRSVTDQDIIEYSFVNSFDPIDFQITVYFMTITIASLIIIDPQVARFRRKAFVVTELAFIACLEVFACLIAVNITAFA